MYTGKMTNELEKLYDKYYERFGVEPDFYEELEYGQSDYDDFLADIKLAIKENKPICEVVEY